MPVDRSVNARDYQVTPDELNYDPDVALPGAEARGKATAQAAAGIQPTAAPDQGQAQQSAKTLNDVEAQITGAPNPSTTSTPKGAAIQPHQFSVDDWSDVDVLKKYAEAGGIDTSKVPDAYWPHVVAAYASAHDHDTMDVVKHWVQATGAGPFIQGWRDGVPEDGIPQADLAKISPQYAEMNKASQFFGHNIQSRLIEEGKYISQDGVNYTPPDSYKYGKIASSLMSNPGAIAGLPQAAKMAGSAVLNVLGKVGQSFEQLAAAHPAATRLLTAISAGGAMGWLSKGGMVGPPIPPP